jgi:hypothetical protein
MQLSINRNYTSVSGLQSFSPVGSDISGDGSVPLEVLIDLRCESSDFDRLVPQTDAKFHYDKFNRLRLRNSVTSVRLSTGKSDSYDHHLHDQTVSKSIYVDFLANAVYRISSECIYLDSLFPQATNNFKRYRIL